MATYYRWRRSTVSYAPQNGASSFSRLQIGPVYPGSENSRTVYYSTEVTANNDNTLTLSGEIKSVVFSNVSTMLSELGVPSGEFYFSTQIENTPNGLVVFCQTDKKSSYQTQSTTGEESTTTSWYIYSGMVNNGYLYPVSSVPTAGTSQGYVYSTSSTAYPNGGVQDGYYYDQRTTVSSPTAPTGLTYPNPITTPSVTVSWGAATSNVPSYAVNLYEVSYSTNGTSWTVAGTTAGTSLAVPIPAGATSITFRVRARDSNNQWGNYVTGTASQVLPPPTLTVPQMVMQGQQATISWTAISGADSYTLQRKANTDADWTQVYSGADTTFTETVGTWTSLQYRVQAVFGETAGGWATSGDIQIVSASALVISGTDGDLGTLTNDVQYTISSDQTSPTIDVTVEVNGGEYAAFQATSGQTYTVSVLDLPTGTGSIVITATTEVSSSPVTVTRTWTYSKTAPTFPETGSVADLTQQGKTIWAKTIAEAVRTPGIWGGNLGLALSKLANAVLYDPETGGFNGIGGADATIPMVSIETGSYLGTGTYGQSNPNTINFSLNPQMVVIIDTTTFAVSVIMVNPCTVATKSNTSSSGMDLHVTWGANSVSWYSDNSPSANKQINVSNNRYYYIAIGVPGGAT